LRPIEVAPVPATALAEPLILLEEALTADCVSVDRCERLGS